MFLLPSVSGESSYRNALNIHWQLLLVGFLLNYSLVQQTSNLRCTFHFNTARAPWRHQVYRKWDAWNSPLAFVWLAAWEVMWGIVAIRAQCRHSAQHCLGLPGSCGCSMNQRRTWQLLRVVCVQGYHQDGVFTLLVLVKVQVMQEECQGPGMMAGRSVCLQILSSSSSKVCNCTSINQSHIWRLVSADVIVLMLLKFSKYSQLV